MLLQKVVAKFFILKQILTFVKMIYALFKLYLLYKQASLTCHVNYSCQILNIILKIEIEAFFNMPKVKLQDWAVYFYWHVTVMSSTRICV